MNFAVLECLSGGHLTKSLDLPDVQNRTRTAASRQMLATPTSPQAARARAVVQRPGAFN